jgi:predicted ATPase
MARLDRLSEVREVAQIGACVGRDFAYELVAGVCNLPEAKLRDALDQLTASELVFRRGVPPEAVYSFKHALIQDAAYDSLLKSKRAQLHARIVDALESRFPDQAASQPELIARHATSAGLHEKAVSQWLLAAQKAHERFANEEAIGHARKGLEVVRSLPAGMARDQLELLLQTYLGLSLSNANGYGAPEVWPAYARARELCDKVGNMPQMFPILGGLFFYYAMRADYESCLQTTEHLLDLARQVNDQGASVLGHWGVCTNFLFLGRFGPALEHARAGWDVYNRLPDRSLAAAFNIDPGPCCADWGAWLYWLRGYPHQAEEWSRKAILAARASGHPFTIVTVLVHASIYQYFRADPKTALEQAREANALCDEVGFPMRKAEADIVEGWALVELGEAEEGMRRLEAGLGVWHQLGTIIGNPLFFAMLAVAHQRTGRLVDAKAALTRAFDAVACSNERQWEAELHRLDGLFRHEAGEPDEEVEACFRRALETAHAQEARSLELRAAISLASLLLRQTRRRDAEELLLPIYNDFPDKAHTKDRKEAEVLLRQLMAA